MGAAVGSAQLYPPRCTIARWDEPGPTSGATAVHSDVRPCERLYGCDAAMPDRTCTKVQYVYGCTSAA